MMLKYADRILSTTLRGRMSGQAWWDLVGPGGILCQLIMPGQAWWDLVRPGGTWSGLVGPGGAWWDLVGHLDGW